MKFPRNVRIVRGQIEVAPFAAVFFLLVLFLLTASLPGVRIELPRADDLPGTDKPAVSVAIDSSGRLYYEYKQVDEAQLKSKLRNAVSSTREPLTLIVQADKAATSEMLVRLSLLARDAGVSDALLATLPRALAPSDRRPGP